MGPQCQGHATEDASVKENLTLGFFCSCSLPPVFQEVGGLSHQCFHNEILLHFVPPKNELELKSLKPVLS